MKSKWKFNVQQLNESSTEFEFITVSLEKLNSITGYTAAYFNNYGKYSAPFNFCVKLVDIPDRKIGILNFMVILVIFLSLFVHKYM